MKSVGTIPAIASLALLCAAGCGRRTLEEDVAVNPAEAVKAIEKDLVQIPPAGKMRGFLMARTEVTQRQWMQVMGTNPSEFRGDDRPVENVSYADCQEFIARLNAASKAKARFRLPTDAEWTHACLAGSRGEVGLRQKGVDGDLNQMAWHVENSQDSTQDVARKSPNAWGLYDMHGNVSEWTCTSTTNLPGQSAAKGEPVYFFYKGGGWGDPPRKCTASDRVRFGESERSPNVGLRLVRQ